ncbi:DOT5 [Candida pseudojiufengensis]|uniref:DOT5 n=1 Tax=Candida pseudojiufengensis TaxID=497109 RepID=UPI0022246AB4|nr:DOT5 [Candida pseudojiufengensis]KAI5959510.1 DOT5 [Candida pseudojiufengensis]
MSGLRRSARVAAQPQPPKTEEPPVKKAKKPSKTNNNKTPQSDVKKKEEKEEKPEPTETKDEETSVELEVGDKLPSIKLLNQNDEEVDLQAESQKHKYLIIFAYPKASTPGCTRQVCGFQKNHKWFTDNNVAVFGISSDTPKNQLNFVQKQGLEYDLISDPEKKIIGLLGAKKSPSGIKRSHWIFVDGVLKDKDLQISPEQSIEGAKEAIENYIKENDGDEKKDDEEPKNGDEENIELNSKAKVQEEDGGYKEDVEDLKT